jgi:two-component system, chemotaxis family, chemotaxis protein CheY
MGKAQPKVLSVGQCGIDGPAIKQLLESQAGAQVDSADSLEDARAKLQSGVYALVLVNRELNQDHSSGIELIAQLAPTTEVPLMLVSDLDDAQQQAQQQGAVPGFGKARLHDEATLQLLQSHLGA